MTLRWLPTPHPVDKGRDTTVSHTDGISYRHRPRDE